MKKSKDYYPVRLTADSLRASYEAFLAVVPSERHEHFRSYLSVKGDDAQWHHDSEAEFFAEYRRDARAAVFQKEDGPWYFRMQLIDKSVTLVEVSCPTRDDVERVFEVVEKHASDSIVSLGAPKPTPIRVFIGHGRNAAWRDLKDHLRDQHGYEVVAYEVGARAGHAVRDVLEEMLEKSSIAFLVLTGEDETGEGAMRARQNVVHELGLFQGRLGFARAIALVEDQTDTFSNIEGIQQLRFGVGRIKETFGDVVATIKREFGARAA